MKRRYQTATLCLLALGCATSCSTKVRGQLMIAVQTDMSLPKDIDRIRVTVTYPRDGGVFAALNEEFSRLGSPDANKLPGTVRFLPPSDPSTPVRIQVSGSRQVSGSSELEASPQVLRDVITTVPENRVATLPIKLEFLCNGEVEVVYEGGVPKRDPNTDNVVLESTCGPDLTCVAGNCVEVELPAEELPEYEEKEIFGGGSGEGDGICFDTSSCFEDATGVAAELTTSPNGETLCEGSVSGEIAGGNFNIALRTQGGGICGDSDCFVALDATEDDTGWKKLGADGKIQLPIKVCEKVQSGQLLGVVAAPVGGAACQLKQSSIPTCGPWSSAGDDVYTPPPPVEAVIIAPGQGTPRSIAVDGIQNTIYWVTQGTFEPAANGQPGGGEWNTDGAVKAVSIDGGEPIVLAEKEYLPNTLVLDLKRFFVLWTSSESLPNPEMTATTRSGRLMSAPFLVPGKLPPPATPFWILNGHDEPPVEPAGIAVQGQTVYWTEPENDEVYKIATSVNEEGMLEASAPEKVKLPTDAVEYNSPTAIAALDDVVCWTYTDGFPSTKGVVACSDSKMTVAVATGQATPQAIAMSSEPRAVYWASFAYKGDGGGIFKVNLPDNLDSLNTTPPTIEPVAEDDFPVALAVEGETVCWTRKNWESVTEGAVVVKRDGVMQEIPNQKNPGAITIHNGVVYWANEGTGSLDGAILKAVLPD